MTTTFRMFCEHERQRDEGAAVVGPRRHRRQSVETNLVGHDLGNRASGAALQTNLEELETQVPSAPKLCRRWGQGGLDKLDQPPNQSLRPLAERQLSPSGGAQQVGDQRDV